MPAKLIRMSRPPKALARLADHPHDVSLGGDIPWTRMSLTPGLPHFAQAGVHLLFGPDRLVGRGQVVDRNVGAVLGEPHGRGLADPRGAAGHQDVLAQQARNSPAPKPGVNGWRGRRHPLLLASSAG